MKQVKKFNDERLDYFCAYCGDTTETKDHVPSKILLEKPYPDNLPVVPACRKCNNELSLDEEYFACLIECARHGTTDPKHLSRKKIKKTLRRNSNLRNRLEKSKKQNGDLTLFDIEIKRVENVIQKLGKGHIRFEYSETCFEDLDILFLQPVSFMSKEQTNDFLKISEIKKFPEIGSRAFVQTFIAEEGEAYHPWIQVQEGTYSYYIENTEIDIVEVRILIWNYLACKLVWQR